MTATVIAMSGSAAVVDEDVAVAVEVLDHRDPGIAADALDEPPAAARDDDVHVGVHGDEHADRGAIARLHNLDRVAGQCRRLEPFVDALGDGKVRRERLRAAAEDGGVAGLHAQGRSVRGDVGPRLVNDADHSERHAHPADLKARRLHPQVAHFADGVRERRDLAQPPGHRPDAGIGELEPVEQRRGEAVRSARVEIPPVGRPDGRSPILDRVRDGNQRCVLGCGGRARQRPGRGPGAGAEVEHVGAQVPGSGFGLAKLTPAAAVMAAMGPSSGIRAGTFHAGHIVGRISAA